MTEERKMFKSVRIECSHKGCHELPFRGEQCFGHWKPPGDPFTDRFRWGDGSFHYCPENAERCIWCGEIQAVHDRHGFCPASVEQSPKGISPGDPIERWRDNGEKPPTLPHQQSPYSGELATDGGQDRDYVEIQSRAKMAVLSRLHKSFAAELAGIIHENVNFEDNDDPDANPGDNPILYLAEVLHARECKEIVDKYLLCQSPEDTAQAVLPWGSYDSDDQDDLVTDGGAVITDGSTMADLTGDRRIVYTAIPKFLVFGNLTIGAFVENNGYAVTTPWQFTYGMAGSVEYESLKQSLNQQAVAADEVWVFAEKEGTFPRHQDCIRHGLGIMDGVEREIQLATEAGNTIRYFHFDAEELTIAPASPNAFEITQSEVAPRDY